MGQISESNTYKTWLFTFRKRTITEDLQEAEEGKF